MSKVCPAGQVEQFAEDRKVEVFHANKRREVLKTYQALVEFAILPVKSAHRAR